jgi:phosphoribosyl-ATP pyrophosphohydrolase
MIIPSIDIMDGRAVQLRRGKEHMLDGGDPLERLAEMSVVGEVAVVDLDAALGRGSNESIMREMVRRAPCRVGGGIRDLDSAHRWLDAGASKIVVGTAADRAFCSALPKERVVAAVDCRHGSVVVDGWRTKTGEDPIDKIRQLADVAGGFLLTQVEYEGCLAGFDEQLVERAVAAAGRARVTAAGGITTPEDISRLARLDADAQIGMALYTGRLTLGDGFASVLEKGLEWKSSETPSSDIDLWPTVVCDESGMTLGLVWSTRASLATAIDERRGVYWSRSRNELWRKGETSGNRQELLRVDIDCDRDALRFTVRQAGAFCHTGSHGCFPERFSLASLERIVSDRRTQATEPESGTSRLFADQELLASKLIEESGELARSRSRSEAVAEAADLLYFTLVKTIAAGASLVDIEHELAQRNLRISRRPMVAKAPPEGGPQ